MIVKTGANYQAEGGYIEASRNGTDVNITTNGENYNFKSDAAYVASLYDVNVKLEDEVPGPIYCIGLSDINGIYTPSSFNLVGTSDRILYAGGNITVYFTIGGTTGITNPVLGEGSRNVIIDKYGSSTARIFVNGPDAVAIIKEGD